MKLDGVFKTLDNDNLKILKKDFPDKKEYLNRKLAYSYEYFLEGWR